MLTMKPGVTAASPTVSTGEGEDPQRRSYRKWYVLGMLALSNILASADRAVVSAITEPLKMSFSLSDKEIGLLSGVAFSATYALAVLPMGYLIDRVNRRTLLSVAISIWSIFTALCATSANFMTLIALRMGVGAAEAPGYSTSLSLIADTFPVKQRNTAVSIYVGAGPLGAIASFAIGAQLIPHFGWRMVFLVVSVPGLLLAALLYLTMREPARGRLDAIAGEAKANEAQPRLSLGRTIYTILRDPVLRYAMAAITISSGVVYSLTAWNTSFLVRVHGLTVSQGAMWTGLGFCLCMSIGSALAGPFTDRFSKGDLRRLTLVPAIAIMITIGAGSAMTLGSTLTASLVGLCAIGLMAGFYIPNGYAIILLLATPERRGTTMAVTMFAAILVGTGLVPLITGAISDALGKLDSIRFAVLLTTMLLLISAFCYMRIRSLSR